MRFLYCAGVLGLLTSSLACGSGSNSAPPNTAARTSSGPFGAGETAGSGASDSGASGGGANSSGHSGGSGASGVSRGTGAVTGGGAACKGIVSNVTSATASNARISVTVDTAASGCRLAPDFVGSNFEAFPGWGADTSMNAFQRQAFHAAGTQLFRFPGGEPAEWTDLLMTTACKDGSKPNWGSPSYASLWTFAKSAGVHSLMLQTNPTTQWCGPDNTQDSSGTHAGALAADAAAHGVSTVFEIGNEPDINGSFFGKMADGQKAYIAKFIEHAGAIHTAAPGAEVYGPAVCGLGGNCSFPVTWDSGWLAAFLAQTGDKASGAGKGSIDGLSLHVYWHNEWGFSDLAQAKIDKYGFAYYWAQTVMPYLRSLIAKYDTRDLPIVISEISVGNGVANDTAQAQNMFSVLETLDTIGAFASSGLRSFQWFDANAAGPADYWLLTTSQARPIYYSFAAWAQMGSEVLGSTSDANPHDVASYATRKTDRSVQVLLINKTKSSHPVTVGFSGFDPSGKRVSIYSIGPATAGSDTATSVIYNGATDPAPSALPAATTLTNSGATASYTLPAYSLAVLSFAP